jgi:hypothetical protein
MPAKAETLSNALLDHVLRNTTFTSPAAVFAALYTVAPTATTSGTEVVTAGGTLYDRVAVTFGAAASSSTSNTGAVTFPVAGASWGTVVAAAMTDNATVGAGNILYFGNLADPKAVGIGDELNFAIGALVVTES